MGIKSQRLDISPPCSNLVLATTKGPFLGDQRNNGSPKFKGGDPTLKCTGPEFKGGTNFEVLLT